MGVKKYTGKLSLLIRPQRRVFVAAVVILVVLLIGGSIVALEAEYAPSSKSSGPSGPTFPRSLFVFQNLHGTPAANSTVTVIRANGRGVRQFESSYTDDDFDQYAGSEASFSSGLLMSNQLSDGTHTSATAWSLMGPDGRVKTIPKILTGTLNNLWDDSGILDGDVYLVGSNYLYGLFENTAGDNFQQINLKTGAIQTAIKILPLGLTSVAGNDVQPKSMNANQSEISFVMNDVSVNGRDVETPSVVVYQVKTGRIAVTSLPSRLDGVAPPQGSPMAYGLSADGKLLAYQQSGQITVGGQRTIGFVTHVYNTQTGKDVATTTGDSINLGVCPMAFSFSNDDRYLVTCGAVSVAEAAIVEVTDTVTGSVVRALNEGSTTDYQLTSAGWSGTDTLVYTTNTTTNGQPFNMATEAAHSLNLRTGTEQNYQTGFGTLLMVIQEE